MHSGCNSQLAHPERGKMEVSTMRQAAAAQSGTITAMHTGTGGSVQEVSVCGRKCSGAWWFSSTQLQAPEKIKEKTCGIFLQIWYLAQVLTALSCVSEGFLHQFRRVLQGHCSVSVVNTCLAPRGIINSKCIPCVK